MVVGRTTCVVLTVMCVAMVWGYHAHHPFSRPDETQHEKQERQRGPAQAASDAGHPEPEGESRSRRYLGDGHIGSDNAEARTSSRPALVVCEQLLVLQHTSPEGHIVACTFSDRLMTQEAKTLQVARWRRETQATMQLVTVDKFLEVVEECLELEEPPVPSPPQWSITSLIQGRAPGALWCGLGQTAQDLAELGAWGPVDHCCRLHDLCPVQLPSYVYYRGAINTTPKPMSHCRCDLQFAVCLNKIKNRAATIVFHMYFNLVFRGGFCATVHPRMPRMSLSRAFGNLWTQITSLLKSWTGSRNKHKRARRKRASSASVTTTNCSHHPSATARPPVSVTHPLQTPPFSSSFSSSFQTVVTTSTVQRTKPETTQQPESPSPPLGLTTDTCMPHHLTPHLSTDVTKKSIHTTPNSSSPTPPLHHIRQRNETPLHSEDTKDIPSHTLEKPQQESQFPWHKQRINCTSEKRPAVSSLPVNDNLNVLIISFRRYLEELAEEMEEREREEEGKEIAEEEESEELVLVEQQPIEEEEKVEEKY
ncbi:hypothetical protein O3P69_013857 [Scylla paramamosain]|uniref:Phospholipase A2-like central domain-containing protein n=1 Tax=Scylla paramamosain TaxID=85552 RepID=A0AAW0SRX6_SCYPA